MVGKTLVRIDGEVAMSGKIVELEAYRGSGDPASHAFRGPTDRNRIMFGESGHAYVYFSYGNHWMLNVTTERASVPGAVLIRALEPINGLEAMRRHRGLEDICELTSGPGKLTKALRIDGSFNGEDITSSDRLFVLDGTDEPKIATSARIGVKVGLNLRWRYFIEGSAFVSRTRRSA